MRHIVLGILAIAFTSSAAFAQGTPDRAAVEKKIMQMEQQINEAFANGDAATFQKMVPVESMGIDPMRGVVKAHEFAEVMKQIKIQPGWKMDNHQMIWVGDDTVIHAYRWTGKASFQGMQLPETMWASTVWTNRNGNWVPMFHQETAAPAPPMKK